MSNFTRKQLINEVSELDSFGTKLAAEQALDTILSIITREVAAGNSIYLGQKFGGFEAFTNKARKGVNPSTGAAIDVPAKQTIKFRASTPLKQTILGA